MLENEAPRRGFGDFSEGGCPSLQFAHDFSLLIQQPSVSLSLSLYCVCVFVEAAGVICCCCCPSSSSSF
ncbi:hypothetical protein RHGRI_000321 [Rhododendron griersonianum]|uniref:Uncharacterized protein n=1 Tax=Rhododendron griersonianum TaxID=479676 RepID=A0AAV6LJ12_9ERIC|nr:hypothetical protein RHGRI_000321 [Rhododendron griersonianum]